MMTDSCSASFSLSEDFDETTFPSALPVVFSSVPPEVLSFFGVTESEVLSDFDDSAVFTFSADSEPVSVLSLSFAASFVPESLSVSVLPLSFAASFVPESSAASVFPLSFAVSFVPDFSAVSFFSPAFAVSPVFSLFPVFCQLTTSKVSFEQKMDAATGFWSRFPV